MNALELSSLRAKHIKEARDRIDHMVERKREYLAGANTRWVIYTGREDRPVWINEDAVKSGKMHVSLSGATRYATEGHAQRIAAQVKNGNGERGVVILLDKAYDLDIALSYKFIDLLSKAETEKLSTPV